MTTLATFIANWIFSWHKLFTVSNSGLLFSCGFPALWLSLSLWQSNIPWPWTPTYDLDLQTRSRQRQISIGQWSFLYKVITCADTNTHIHTTDQLLNAVNKMAGKKQHNVMCLFCRQRSRSLVFLAVQKLLLVSRTCPACFSIRPWTLLDSLAINGAINQTLSLPASLHHVIQTDIHNNKC